jgi:hypothetical protein
MVDGGGKGLGEGRRTVREFPTIHTVLYMANFSIAFVPYGGLSAQRRPHASGRGAQL